MTKEQKSQYQRAWRVANPGYDKAWNAKNPDKKNAKRRKWLYGITLAQYNEMYVSQEGKCKICRAHQAQLKRSLSVDHCHKTGRVRALLCDLCNRALGFLKDDAELVKVAANYLEEHSGPAKK